MILLGIGSNLESKFGNRFSNIRKTIDLLNKEEVTVIKVSSFYETPSYPDNSLPKFINVIVKVKFSGDPVSLLKKIFKIEKEMGRVRKAINEPRTCDIDIIDFNGQILENGAVKLPHPKLHERNFVLYPLFEICPDWIHPLNNKKIDILIKKLTLEMTNQITRMKESDILYK